MAYVGLQKKITEYEEKAKALLLKAQVLREALAEMNGHLTTKAQATIDKKLQRASKTRTESKWAGMNRPQLMAERQALIRAFLSISGPDGVRLPDIVAHLAGLGFPKADTMTVRNTLYKLEPKRHGQGISTRYALGGRGGKKPAYGKKGYWDGNTVQARRARTKALLDKAAASDHPLPAKELGGGIIAGLVKNGYLKKEGDGFVRTNKEFTV